MRAFTLATLVTLAGCADLLGIEDLTLSDAGSLPPGTVAGRWDDTFHTLDGDEVVARDLTGYVIEAYIPDAAATGGYRVESGAVTADGSFTIENVPDNETYLLKVIVPNSASSLWFETDQRNPQLGLAFIGRPDAVLATPETAIEVQLDSLIPWRNNPNDSPDQDYLTWISFNVGTLTESLPEPLPVDDDTTLSGLLPWTNAVSLRPDRAPRLVDATRGDDLHVLRYRIEGIYDAWTIRLLDLFETSTFTMLEGQANPLTGSFVPATSSRVRSVNAQIAFYEGQYSPLTTSFGFDFYWLASPFDVRDTAYRGLLIHQLWAQSTYFAPFSALSGSFNDPFPASWTRHSFYTYRRARALRHPGANVPANNDGGYLRAFTLGRTYPSMPDLAAPTVFEVDGEDAAAGGRITLDTGEPVTVSWVGASNASYYQVNVFRVTDSNNLTRTTLVSTIRTTETTLGIPQEVFSGGPFFALVVHAYRAGTTYDDGKLQITSFPYSRASTPSGLLRMDSTCGDGDMNASEDCDSGESASSTCDVDCTAPICGDGWRNAQAGEVCDTGFDSFSCDADCTAVICGDGHTNLNVEQCDDGNDDDDGNGCSAACRRNNWCGNGSIASAVETCDDGNELNRDGCDYRCQVEGGYECVGEPSICTPIPKG